MISRTSSALLVLALVVPGMAPAQQTAAADLEVRTFTLSHLSPSAAAAIIEPYIVSANGRVFGADQAERVLTVREAPRVLARIQSVLQATDKPPATVRLRFQLVAAQDEPARDARIASLDSTLRDLFRFGGYRFLSQTAVTVSEWRGFSQTFFADGERLLLTGRVNGVTTGADSGRVSLEVTLSRPDVGAVSTAQRDVELGARVLSTGLSIPIGQTVVLGSGVSSQSIQALILVVTPEVPGARR